MTTMFEKPEKSFEELVQTTNALRRYVSGDMDLLFRWQDKVSAWDKKFKIELEERFGNKRYAQQVPAWQTLIGGTVEPETDITDTQRSFINEKVSVFVKNFMEENDISPEMLGSI